MRARDTHLYNLEMIRRALDAYKQELWPITPLPVLPLREENVRLLLEPQVSSTVAEESGSLHSLSLFTALALGESPLLTHVHGTYDVFS